MRLSQLARKLGVTHSDIIKFVENLDATVSLSAHSKIEDTLIDKIKEQFDPTGEKFLEQVPIAELDVEDVQDTENNSASDGDSENEIEVLNQTEENLTEAVESTVTIEEVEPVIEETADHDVPTEPEPIEEVQEVETPQIETETIHSESSDGTVSEASIAQENLDVTSETSQESESDAEELVEGVHSDSQFIDTDRYAEDESAVIRAKLVKLEGIKVVGKIDLPPPPQPKVKEEKEENAESGTANQRSHRGRKSRKNNRNRKPESLRQKQEKEKRKQERERRAQEKKVKAKKKQHYIEKLEKGHINKIATSKRTKSQKRKAAENRKPMIQKSKNPVKRFWHWLNGKYDEY
ncbi:MAG: hypothetical protein AAFQ94_25875 [Bacteroidota bacterium]